MTKELELCVEFVQSTFRVLAKACPYRNSGWDLDCHHPDLDAGCMDPLCAPCNCPLLLPEEPETDLECFRGEDSSL